MDFKVNDKGKIELDMWDIIHEVVANTPEDDMWSLVEMVGGQDRMFKFVSEALAEEFSRPNYNTHCHEAREMFLKHIKQQEIKWYASLIASKVPDAKKNSEAYWKLYDWCSKHEVGRGDKTFPTIFDQPSSTDFAHELEVTIEQAFLEKMPEVAEPKS